ncbi:MAG: sugar phosphate isomerase/epimerase [Opitutaceae bacterium]|nr:sugar phosphate isomerase/epimerase [Opitutaceae bacterium]
MNLPLHHCIKPGIVHNMAFPACMKGEGPVVETIRTILADPYFEVIEFTWIKDPAARAQVKRMLAASGIDARYAAHPRLLTQKLDLNSLDPAARARAVDEMKAGLDEAAELGLREYVLLSGWDVAPERRPAAMDALEQSLSTLCAYAADRGQNIVLEVFDREVDKKCLVGPAASAREIAERVKRTHRNFGLLVDLSHIVLIPETPAQALLPVKEHLVHVHIGNAYIGPDRANPVWGDNHPRFGYPGGLNDVPEIAEFLRVLLQIGYLKADGSARGAVSFEIKPVGDEDPALMLACAKRKLGEAWARL